MTDAEKYFFMAALRAIKIYVVLNSPGYWTIAEINNDHLTENWARK